MNLQDYDYILPPELIAQKPASERDQSRLLVLRADTDSVEHRSFRDLTGFINDNDIVVVNNTRVFPARLIGQKVKTGGEVEIFLLREHDDDMWEALSRPAKRLRPGTVVVFGDGILQAEIIDKGENGFVRVKLSSEIDIEKAIDSIGKTPLPPYIKRESSRDDSERYQTVYAKHRGSVAAPTAGLHFTDGILSELKSRGIPVASVTLHVGIGTFRPLSEDEAKGDSLHDEFCIVPAETVAIIRKCRDNGGRVFVIGTTAARALETASASGTTIPFEGWTNIFLKPPYRFKAVDALVTNFHLPRSSLLMMVSAFAGRETVISAYEEAVKLKYRFYSYGDAMLIIGRNQ